MGGEHKTGEPNTVNSSIWIGNQSTSQSVAIEYCQHDSSQYVIRTGIKMELENSNFLTMYIIICALGN